MAAITYFADFQNIPRSVYIIYWLLAVILVGSSRYWVRLQFQQLHNRRYSRAPVLIYGAGHSGTQLANALTASVEFLALGFIDDNPELQKLSIQGLKVYAPDN